jgi:hypothetical protein
MINYNRSRSQSSKHNRFLVPTNMQYFFSIKHSCHDHSPLFHSLMHGLVIPCILYMLPYLFLVYSSSLHINGIALPLPPCRNYYTRLNPCVSLSSFAPARSRSESWRTCGTSRGCWRGKEMCTPRQKSNPIQNFRVWLRVQLGVQDHLAFHLTHNTHTTSVTPVVSLYQLQCS